MKLPLYVLLILSFHSSISQTKNIIFIAGKEQVCTLSRQVELFKLGYSTPAKLISFKYTDKTADILKTIKNNQDFLVVMFSAGCQKAKEILLSNLVNHQNVYLIEPYAPNDALSFVLEYTKFQGKNIFVGPNRERGKGIAKVTISSNSKYHCESLTTVGMILKSK